MICNVFEQFERRRGLFLQGLENMANSEPSGTSKIKLFGKIVSGFQSLTIFADWVLNPPPEGLLLYAENFFIIES